VCIVSFTYTIYHEMHHTKCAVYVGAGSDVRPILALPNVKTFVYVDALPMHDQPLKEDWKPSMMHANFTSEVDAEMKSNGFEVMGYDVHVSAPAVERVLDVLKRDIVDQCYPFRRTYVGGDQTILYYFNCPTPACNNLLEQVMSALKCDLLVSAGHNPHASLLDILPDTCTTFAGLPGTVYGNADDGVYLTLDEETSLMSEYYIVGTRSRKNIRCKDMHDLHRRVDMMVYHG
jgi:hypothetical protein